MEMREVEIVADSGLFILIWLVQLIIYPSFRHIVKDDFIVWHSRYMNLISLVVGPLFLLQIGVEVVYTFNFDFRWGRILLISAVLAATFCLSVPCHKNLNRYGNDPLIISRLVLTNWLRTVVWSLLFAGTVLGLYR